MIRKLLSLLILAMPLTVVFAERITFAYDLNGNRVKREITIETYSEKVSRDSIISDRNKDLYYSEILSEKEVKIYPNPTYGDLMVEIGGFDERDSTSISIFDLSGKMIESHAPSSPTVQFDITRHPAGIYILNVMVNGEKTSWRIIKK